MKKPLLLSALAATILSVLSHGLLAAPIVYDPFAAGGATPNTAAGQYRTGTGYSSDALASTTNVAGQAPTVLGFSATGWTPFVSPFASTTSPNNQLPLNTEAPSYASFTYHRTENNQLVYQDTGARVLNTIDGQSNLFRASSTSNSGKQIARNLTIGNSLPSQMYFSMLTQVTDGAELNAQFTSANTGNSTDRRPFYFGINENGNPYVTGTSVSGGSTISAITTDVNTNIFLDDGQPHFLVLKMTDAGPTLFDRLDLYVDPNLLDESLNTPVASIAVGNFYVAGNSSWTINNLMFDNMVTSGNMSVIIDELRMGATFADVTPFTQTPEPTSLAAWSLLGLIATGLLLWRKRKASA